MWKHDQVSRKAWFRIFSNAKELRFEIFFFLFLLLIILLFLFTLLRFTSITSFHLHSINTTKVLDKEANFFETQKVSLCSAQNNQLKLKVKWIICEFSKRAHRSVQDFETQLRLSRNGSERSTNSTRQEWKWKFSSNWALSLLSQSLSFLMTMHTRVKSLKRRRRWSFCHRWREKVARLLSLNHNEPSRREAESIKSNCWEVNSMSENPHKRFSHQTVRLSTRGFRALRYLDSSLVHNRLINEAVTSL